MTECDACGCTATHVWRHRVFGSEAHRTVEWVCASCHPDLPDIAEPDCGCDGDADADDDSERVLVTDGGHAVFTCPDCAGSTVNGQGLFACVDCNWSGPL
ncbi:MAG: hypothetical protein ABEI77_03640 [Halorientalis sp.]